MRSLRSRSRDTRLAVMFATAPASNERRAFAMSTNGVSTGTPTADTDRTAPPTNVRTRSMSWIIRSSTTATSEPRGLNGARRLLSMNRGDSTNGNAARTARLNRSTCPVCTTAPVRARDRQQAVRLLERRGDRLFDQHVQSALERRRRDGVVRRRRNDDAHRVDDVEQRIERRERFDAELRRHLLGARRIGLVETHELGARHVAENPRMMKS